MGSRSVATRQDLAAQADGWDPATVSQGSGRLLPWKCELGHRWNASPNNRSKGRGCPYCANKKVLAGFNDLATTHPELAAEAFGWDPTTLVAGSNKVVSWICGLGHHWKSSVINRQKGRGCGVCAGKQVVKGFNDLATRFPDIAAEAFGWDPTTVTAFSSFVRKWRCPSGHTYESPVLRRTGLYKSGCGICAGKRVAIGVNDLATTHPDIAAQADGWDPSTVVANSGFKRHWRCDKGHTWQAVISSRTRGLGCPYCANKKALAGFNDLASLRPEVAARATGWDPTTVTIGSKKKMTWLCTFGHTYLASVRDQTKRTPTGCPICQGDQVLVGFNDLATIHPRIAAEANGWDPTTVVAGSNERRPWRCSLGHEWNAVINLRKRANCPICSNKKVLVGYNDLATTHPELAAESHEWDPTTATYGSSRQVQWKCQFGHIWKSSIADRTRGNGCPTCSSGGYDPNAPAWFYLLEHDAWNLHQCGISNHIERRLQTHIRNGWTVLDVRGPLPGDRIRDLETHALRSIKKRGVRFADTLDLPRFDGWTESWPQGDMRIQTISDLLKIVYDDEGY